MPAASHPCSQSRAGSPCVLLVSFVWNLSVVRQDVRLSLPLEENHRCQLAVWQSSQEVQLEAGLVGTQVLEGERHAGLSGEPGSGAHLQGRSGAWATLDSPLPVLEDLPWRPRGSSTGTRGREAEVILGRGAGEQV